MSLTLLYLGDFLHVSSYLVGRRAGRHAGRVILAVAVVVSALFDGGGGAVVIIF